VSSNPQIIPLQYRPAPCLSVQSKFECLLTGERVCLPILQCSRVGAFLLSILLGGKRHASIWVARCVGEICFTRISRSTPINLSASFALHADMALHWSQALATAVLSRVVRRYGNRQLPRTCVVTSASMSLAQSSSARSLVTEAPRDTTAAPG
jgi:hypothetical protein